VISVKMNPAAPPLLDPFNRRITSLRVSVTDKCNYRCTYCMPASGIALKPHHEILRLEQVAEVIRVAATLGISKIKLTGGEPLVRRNIESLVAMIAAIPGITDFGMTTNGSLLTPDMAQRLKNAGLMRLNISLDTLDPARFAAITRGGDVRDVLRGIEAALGAGFAPIKVNMVVFEDTSDADREVMRTFCAARSLRLQTIAHFSLDRRESHDVGTTDKPPPCAGCNRLRLTADGYLKPCQFSDQEIRVDFSDIARSIRAAVDAKPSHGSSCANRNMNQIGG
jgi:cyclic pyranopterin phosphate synthase